MYMTVPSRDQTKMTHTDKDRARPNSHFGSISIIQKVIGRMNGILAANDIARIFSCLIRIFVLDRKISKYSCLSCGRSCNIHQLSCSPMDFNIPEHSDCTKCQKVTPNPRWQKRKHSHLCWQARVRFATDHNNSNAGQNHHDVVNVADISVNFRISLSQG